MGKRTRRNAGSAKTFLPAPGFPCSKEGSLLTQTQKTPLRLLSLIKPSCGQYYGYDALNPRVIQIVGVVKDSRVNDVREDVPPTVYHSLSQDVQDVGSLNVRTFSDP